MIYQLFSWIASYSWDCHDTSRYEYMLTKVPTPPPCQSAQWREPPPHHRQLLHPSQHAGCPYIIQQDTCLYNIQDLEPEDIAERMRIKKKQADKRQMRRTRRTAEIQVEKVKQLRRQLQMAHKRSRTEDGVLGITWWNREYWGTGFEVKRLGIKKEEPLTPLLIKVKPPPTCPLTYPLSQTLTSWFRSIDPNNFVWSPIYAPSPF